MGREVGKDTWESRLGPGTKGLEELVMVFSSHLVSCDMPLSV